MSRFIYIIMLLLPLYQTWLARNSIPYAKSLDEIVYIIFTITFCIDFIKNNMTIKDGKVQSNTTWSQKIKVFWNDMASQKIVVFYLLFIFIGLFSTVLKMQFEEQIGVKGVLLEFFKLTRNIPILLFGYYFTTKEEFKKFSKLYVIVSSIMVFVGILQYFIGIEFYKLFKLIPETGMEYKQFVKYVHQNRNFSLLHHPNVFGEFVVVTFFMLLSFEIFNISIFNNKQIQRALLLFSFVGILISASRATFLLTILLPIFFAVRYGLKKVKKIFIILCIISSPFLVFAISQLTFKLWQYKHYTVELGRVETRIVYWMDALELFTRNLFTGTGWGTWGDISAKYSNLIYNSNKPNIMSDSYLSHLLAENGINIIWLIIAIFLLIKNFSDSFSNTDDKFIKCLNILGMQLLFFVMIASIKSMGLGMFENTFFMFYVLGFILQNNKITLVNKAIDKQYS